MNQKPVPGKATRGRWAPWWAYLIPILGANYLRQWLVPAGTWPVLLDGVLAVLLAGAIFLLVTGAFRAARRRRSSEVRGPGATLREGGR